MFQKPHLPVQVWGAGESGRLMARAADRHARVLDLLRLSAASAKDGPGNSSLPSHTGVRQAHLAADVAGKGLELKWAYCCVAASRL